MTDEAAFWRLLQSPASMPQSGLVIPLLVDTATRDISPWFDIRIVDKLLKGKMVQMRGLFCKTNLPPACPLPLYVWGYIWPSVEKAVGGNAGRGFPGVLNLVCYTTFVIVIFGLPTIVLLPTSTTPPIAPMSSSMKSLRKHTRCCVSSISSLSSYVVPLQRR